MKVPISFSSLYLIRHEGRKSYLETNNDIFETNESLSSLLARLDNKKLYRLTRSLVINIDNIKSIFFNEKDYNLKVASHEFSLSTKDFLSLNKYIKEVRERKDV